mmetsp:Transcript_124940/g.221381  ORF Transcript_124940/g.221381 Transcript_124940/m.221381 type:complete len:109 (+) Transcript_124940:59-385(+)
MTRVSTLTHFLLVAVLMHHGQSLHTPLVRNAANASVPPLRNASVPPLEEKQLRNSTLDDSRSSIASMIEEEEEEKEGRKRGNFTSDRDLGLFQPTGSAPCETSPRRNR